MSGWWSGHKVINPTELESRFSVEDGMGFMETLISEELSDESVEQLDRVKSVIDQLPPREADFVELYFFYRRKQTDIAQIFSVSQPTVCYRLQRATARVKFLLSLPPITSEEVREMSSFLKDPLDIEIMVLMFETTCQSEVAKQLSVSQGLVRHRFIRSIEKGSKIEGMEQYTKLFRSISENLNILREVQRSTWNDKVSHVIV